MSFEAMAMAGMDYKKCGISLEECETLYPHQSLHLLVEPHQFPNLTAEAVKAKIQKWAKAVASCSNQHTVTNHK
ncbi:hypothetical protein DEO72_LG6g3370 [Vigna unguiculata]|uniref:Uncharacterized protein n=1 Tax=Vigna unguiculata TaxID=3917 RepID=A0A4D6ME78_VIGUN|nr:hypothetical protein DEO72_LG6g3370 [Vigna unguiculata]